ncbi:MULTISPECIES: sulfate ABC transporter permease subunit CysT [Brevibacillus]|jgi:sulfate ABC transporter, permease protein CysT|uniref:Sulfate transport system permease protein CysT n=1 Tax=Brevibacillus parabrevis TaxID=54914 RepID=A0A4Y3PR72_BREPA|nr:MULTISPECIES: sulfate ABC transporter permease subunit CysT [Brevibacillus]MBU8712261.1 sulfate ABC transporter permease subunit CysT [Brevibacillus parabrevis]MDH6349331.1 sulfate transport system permease protein [Brevibacillus sp. 1238]MDR5001344.1 sulfate ABC transporter permease subunit CysT [Brevibacillus parabrevis]MED2257399.1 sulfate ABC transporter permease subunit CysT [Brevibacillus parabrevis]WDV97786.1 sulfate ABC transporter permease subunit CysT [Brevibacillus parabrevis]
MRKSFLRRGFLPGFGMTMGYTIIYLSLLVLIPLSVLFLKATTMSWEQFVGTILDPRVIASIRVSILTSFFAACVNAVFGVLVAWVLTRYDFFGKRIIDGIVDLPFALPTAVGGIALTSIYAENGWIGQYLAEWGVKVAYTPIGIWVALTFIGLPFVVRTVQPVLQDWDLQMEEAAATLGATRFATFTRVILPHLLPAIITGFALAFARALGEYGSVVFISGNMPLKTEIVPLLIMTKLEQFDYAGATAIATVMLVASFVMLLLINYLQWRINKFDAAR